MNKRVIGIVGALIVGLGSLFAIASPAAAVPSKAATLPYGPYQIKAEGSNKCLDIYGGWYENGTYAQMYDCLGSTQFNQLFFLYVSPSSPYEYQIVADHSGKCLDIEQASQSSFARALQYDCMGWDHTNQVFYLADAGGYFYITPTHSWQGLTWQGLFNGAQVYQVSGSAAHWVLVPV